MDIAVRIEPDAEGRAAPEVEYRWDADTTILCATVRAAAPPRAVSESSGPPFEGVPGLSGSVEIEGKDGSWLVLDVAEGSVRGVEVAVWPDLRHRASLRAPADAEVARVVVPSRRAAAAAAADLATAGSGGRGGRGREAAGGASDADSIESLEVNTAIVAEADEGERTIHFLLGAPRPARRVRVARDLVFDVDERSRLAGLWLLNVPPCPTDLSDPFEP